jgi:hypothetical protein
MLSARNRIQVCQRMRFGLDGNGAIVPPFSCPRAPRHLIALRIFRRCEFNVSDRYRPLMQTLQRWGYRIAQRLAHPGHRNQYLFPPRWQGVEVMPTHLSATMISSTSSSLRRLFRMSTCSWYSQIIWLNAATRAFLALKFKDAACNWWPGGKIIAGAINVICPLAYAIVP